MTRKILAHAFFFILAIFATPPSVVHAQDSKYASADEPQIPGPKCATSDKTGDSDFKLCTAQDQKSWLIRDDLLYLP